MGECTSYIMLNLLNRLLSIIRDILFFLTIRRNIHFYFTTLTFFDSLLALFFSLCVILRLPIAKNGLSNLSIEVKKYFNPKEVFFYGSARSALCALLKSLEFEPDSEVIITGFTCDVVPNAIIQAGLKPIYADIDPKTFCMSPESVGDVMTNKTKAIVIQHTFGIPANLEKLLSIVEEHNLFTIEDCAVSLGTYYKDRPTGTFGDAAIFSFELSKTITSCRGGMLCINTNKRDCLVRHLNYYKSVPEQSVYYSSNILFQLGLSGVLYRPVIYNLGKYILSLMFKIGFFKKSTPLEEKYGKIGKDYMVRLSNQQAVIINRQWRRLNKICIHSKDICLFYYTSLKKNERILPLKIDKNDNWNLIRYPILIENREKLFSVYNKKRIELGLWFTAPLSSPETNAELFKYFKGTCSKAEMIANKICNLPTHIKVTKGDLNRIIYVSLKTL